VAVQVTRVLELPLTEALNFNDSTGNNDADEGLILTATNAAAGAWIVIAAVADFVLSARLVAVTVAVPGLLPAVNTPAGVIVPPVAVHVTLVSLVPVTLALKLWLEPSFRVNDDGLILTATDATEGAWMVIAAVADFVVSAWLVAVTVAAPAVLPAVNTPTGVIVPPVAVHATLVSLVPVTLALKLWLEPSLNINVDGLTVTVMRTIGVTEVSRFVGPPPPHPNAANAAIDATADNTSSRGWAQIIWLTSEPN
jgi:hypothetical protein